MFLASTRKMSHGLSRDSNIILIFYHLKTDGVLAQLSSLLHLAASIWKLRVAILKYIIFIPLYFNYLFTYFSLPVRRRPWKSGFSPFRPHCPAQCLGLP